MLDILAQTRKYNPLVVIIATLLIGGSFILFANIGWLPWLFLGLGCTLAVYALLVIHIVTKHRRQRVNKLLKLTLINVIGIGEREPESYVDFIFNVKNESGYSVAIIGIDGWIEINDNRCGITPQISIQNFPRNDKNTHDIRIHQPITVQMAREINGVEVSIKFSTCNLILDTGDKILLAKDYKFTPIIY